jgi:hypothetical protein
MSIRVLAFLLFLAQAVLAQQPTPILPDPKLTPGDTFDVTAQDVCAFPATPRRCGRCNARVLRRIWYRLAECVAPTTNGAGYYADNDFTACIRGSGTPRSGFVQQSEFYYSSQ